MHRIRSLPDGRYVERDNSGVLYFRQPDGSLIQQLERGGEVYVMLGLRPQHDDHAMYNPADPTTINDPDVRVWIGALGRYGSRAESNLDKYGSETPSDEQIESGGNIDRPAGVAQPVALPAAPAPQMTVAAGEATVARRTTWQRIVSWLRRRFS